MISSARARRLPLTHVTSNRKVQCQAHKDYYESKIRCLMDMNMPVRLIVLACWDAPVKREDLSTKRGQRRFLKKCLKYYKKCLKEVEREEKNL